MRQLTSLDAQFLGVETARTYGHVGGLAVYDPSTAPGGKLEIGDVCRHGVASACTCCRRSAGGSSRCRSGIDLPVLGRGPRLRPRLPHPRERGPAARRRPPARRDRRADLRAPARPLAPAVGAVPDPRAARGGRVAMLTKLHHSMVDGVSGNEILGVLLDPSPEGKRDRRRQPRATGRRARPAATSRCSGAGCSACRASRCARCARCRRRCRTSPTCPGANAFPGVPSLSHALARAPRAAPTAGVLEVTTARPPKTRFNGPRLAAPALRVRLALARHRQAAQERARHHRQRRRRRAVRDRRARLAARPRRAAGRAAGGDDPGVGAHRGAAGTFGNRISTMIVPIPTNVPDPRERLQRAHEYCAAPRSATARCRPTC